MSLDYDEELPAGFQDADIQQAAFEEEAREAARLRRQGVCTHGSRLGRRLPPVYTAEQIAEWRSSGHFPDRPTDPRVTGQASIPEGMDLCLDCGQLVPDPFAGR